MVNTIESYVMIDQINNVSKFKSVESNSDLAKEEAKVQDAHEKHEAVEMDDVNISHASKQLEALKNYIKDAPIDNEQKVNAIKAQVQAGDYKINSENVAAKILSEIQSA